jgi:hypothetical protein
LRVLKKDGTRTGNKDEVKKEVKERWENEVWKDKPRREDFSVQPWHKTKFMEKVYDVVQATDQTHLPFTLEEIKRILECCGAKDIAPGIDEAINEVFYYARELIAEYILEIFNEFKKDENEFPDEWKISRIFLIYKDSPDGTEENPLEYRPDVCRLQNVCSHN